MLIKAYICAGLTLCVVACASAPPAPTVTAPSATSSAQPHTGCVESGSRIPTDCTAPGRAYDQQAIKSTGQTDAAQALRQLDPTVTVSH